MELCLPACSPRLLPASPWQAGAAPQLRSPAAALPLAPRSFAVVNIVSGSEGRDALRGTSARLSGGHWPETTVL